MATFKTEIINLRADNTYLIRLRITHNGQVKRLSTSLYVHADDVTASRKIRNTQVLSQCQKLTSKCIDICNGIGPKLPALSLNELAAIIREGLTGAKEEAEPFRLDLFEFAETKLPHMSPNTARNYQSALSALRKFLERDTLDISEVNAALLRKFEAFITGPRAKSAYLGYIRALHNRAKEDFNDEDRGYLPIPFSPFKHFRIKPQPITRKRALSVETIQRIIDLPDAPERLSTFNQAKDCFLLSFALIGMNSADMYHAGKPVDGVLTYYRRKTTGRRADKAEMRVRLPPAIDRLLEKYADDHRLFNFYKRHSTMAIFNQSVNGYGKKGVKAGLKAVGERVGVEDLEFYAARHSWATIARSRRVGIEKATVHEALNHVDGDMKTTDIYVDRDWSVIWEANERVLALFDWSAVGYSVL